MIALSVVLQVVLGALTVHPYDGRVFLAAGYSVAHGRSPYEWANVSDVFGSSIFPNPVSGIGYPPPWSLVLGLSYSLSYNLFPNVIFYNIVMKVPIIAGNILLALLTGRIVFFQSADAASSKESIKFMLFNPFIIYTTAIWGQFDTIAALAMMFAMFELTQRKTWQSAVALGVATALKLIPIALIPLAVLYTRRASGRLPALKYLLCVAAVLGLSLTPFLFNWSIGPIIGNWYAHFVHIGAFSPMNLLLLLEPDEIPSSLGFLGYLWIPSFMLVYYILSRRSITDFMDLTLSSLAPLLGLFLSRMWVSEQNLNFILPLVLLGTVSGCWSRRWLMITWTLPLIFTFFNSSPFLMLFLVIPESTLSALSFHTAAPTVVKTARISLTTVWLVVGLILLKKSIDGLEESPHLRCANNIIQAVKKRVR